jgi:hypothetical protein
VKAAPVFALFLSFIMLSGALGLRTQPECDSDPKITRNSEKMNCYYGAAITAAYLCRPGTECRSAKTICEDIWTKFGAPIDPDSGSDMRPKAELVSNQCYYEIAKITRYPSTCAYVLQRDNLGTQLFGEQVTRDMCEEEVTRLAALAPENYYQSNPNNICAIVFVLPLLFLAAVAGPRLRQAWEK